MRGIDLSRVLVLQDGTDQGVSADSSLTADDTRSIVEKPGRHENFLGE